MPLSREEILYDERNNAERERDALAEKIKTALDLIEERGRFTEESTLAKANDLVNDLWTVLKESNEEPCEHLVVIPVLVGNGVKWLCKNRDCKQEFVPWFR
jgi:hypothetical protein